jgi:UDP-N-acetylglucosamine acyltransferase
MSERSHCHIHPTAVVSAEAELSDGVIRPGAYLFGPLTMGCDNQVYSGAVLGDRPQHLRYHDEPTSVEIGDGNIFREGVTVHRGTAYSGRTVIGNNNFFMVNSHVAHDCVIGDRCLITNGALIAGHCVLEDNVILSGNSAIQQFVRVGRLAMLGGVSGATRDIPPFVVQQGIDTVSGVNVIGMRRAGFANEEINAVKIAFRVLYREGLPLPAALGKLERDLGRVDVVRSMIEFLQGCTKGISPMRSRFRDEAA